MNAVDNSLVSLENVWMYQGDQPTLEAINLTVSRNEIVTLIGPNGAGKSTLVKIALGLISPGKGKVSMGSNIRYGYVPQDVNLDHTLPVTVKRFLKLSGAKKTKDIEHMLNLVGAVKTIDQSMSAISGGELRRVLLARALLTRPDLLILDEPTSGVDINGQASLYSLIQQIRDQFNCGILLVSHNLHIVMAATDRVICLNKHLCCSGTPDHVQQHPEFVALFGSDSGKELGFYRHQHDHDHDIHGNILSRSSRSSHDHKHG